MLFPFDWYVNLYSDNSENVCTLRRKHHKENDMSIEREKQKDSYEYTYLARHFTIIRIGIWYPVYRSFLFFLIGQLECCHYIFCGYEKCHYNFPTIYGANAIIILLCLKAATLYVSYDLRSTLHIFCMDKSIHVVFFFIFFFLLQLVITNWLLESPDR